MNARDRAAADVADIAAADVRTRLVSADWEEVARDLDARGSAVIERVLSPAHCRSIAALYEAERAFAARS